MANKELDHLVKLYKAAREQLLNTIIYTKGVGSKVYANTILKRLERQLKKLAGATKDYAITEIPAEYRKSLAEVYDYFQKNNLLMTPENQMFAGLHTDAIHTIAREMQYQVHQGLAQVGRQVQRYVQTSLDDALRSAGLSAAGEKMAAGATLSDMRKRLIDMLQQEGFMTVQYGQGPGAYQVRVENYASMVARSTTREASNTAKLNAAMEHGYDLVLFTEHYPTCEICAPIQGRVYSISGEDKRFPALDMLPGFKDGYKNLHPNCRHVLVPTVERLWTDEERKKYLADGIKPITGDTRSPQEVSLYNKQQADARRLREDLYQYERYKQRLGEDAPKTFAAFRRLKRANGETWGFMQLDYRRRSRLAFNPDLALPNADKVTAADTKFSKYLFNPDNPGGWAKGVAFDSRLGYNIKNWEKLREELIKRAPWYPVTFRDETVYGKNYEQRIIVYGLRGKPANVVVGWAVDGERTWLVTALIKEVE